MRQKKQTSWLVKNTLGTTKLDRIITVLFLLLYLLIMTTILLYGLWS